MFVIKNGRIIFENGLLEGKNIIIQDGKILDITDELPSDAEIYDAKGNFVAPGFIDMHIHGAAGHDTMDGSVDSIKEISLEIAKHGVTSFLPTTMTVGIEEIKKSVKAVKESIEFGTEGASVLGVHLEGPFISEKMKGAQDSKYIKKPDINTFMEIAEDVLPIIKRVTISPEEKGADELIKFLVGHGIVVSVGHSNGTYDEIMDGISRGISHSTHLYNAMRPFNHREPGVVGAIFDSRITCEFIADGIHMHFAAIRMALTLKGYENCALITDAMQACGLKDGVYSLGGQEVFVKDGAARLADGTLAGSTLTLDTAVRNIMKNTTLNIAEAVSMASSIPAKILKINDKKGYIKPGYDADITIIDPDINVINTIVQGRIVI